MSSGLAGDRSAELVCRNDVIPGDGGTSTHKASPTPSHPCAILGVDGDVRQRSHLDRWQVVHNSQHLLLLSPEFQLHNKDVGKALQ